MTEEKLIEEEIEETTEFTEPAELEKVIVNDEVIGLLKDLNEKFDSKIQNDEWKNKKYDEMHSLMLKYQDDMLAKTIDPLLKSIIQLSDSIKKDIKFYNTDEANEDLCNILYGITEQIDTILFDYDIEPYSADMGVVNSKEQKIIKTILTDDEGINNHVAEILTTGYKKGDKIFRMERVNIYKYFKTEDNENE